MGNLDRWIGIVGVILGLPGFLLFFVKGQHALALLSLLILVVALVAAYLINRAGKLPPYRMKSVRVDLHLLDTLGENATLQKTYEAVPSYAHLQEMTHRNIAADGAVVNLQWDGNPIPEQWITQVLGEYHITVRFPGPLVKGKQLTCCLSYDVLRSFLQSQEALIYVCDFPAKEVNILIHFPQDRMCTEASCFRVQGAGKIPLTDPVLDRASRTISLKLKKPEVGAEIEIWWRW